MNQSITVRTIALNCFVLLTTLGVLISAGCGGKESVATSPPKQRKNNADTSKKRVEAPEGTEEDQRESKDNSDQPSEVTDKRFDLEPFLIDDFFAAIVIPPTIFDTEYKYFSVREHLRHISGLSTLDVGQVRYVAMFVAPVPESLFSQEAFANAPSDLAEVEGKEVAPEEPLKEPGQESEPADEKPRPASEVPEEPSPDFEGLFEGLQPEPKVDPDERSREGEPALDESIAWRVPSYVSRVIQFHHKDHARSFVTELVVAHHFIVADHEGKVYYKQIGPDEFLEPSEDPEQEKAELNSPTVLAAIYMSDDGTVIIGPEFHVKKMIASERSAGALKGWLSCDQTEMYAVAAPGAVIETVKNVLGLCDKQSNTEVLRQIEDLTMDLNDLIPVTISLKFSISSDEPLRLQFFADDKQELKKLRPLLERVPALVKSAAPGIAKGASPTSAFILETLLGFVADTGIQIKNGEISLVAHADAERRNEIYEKATESESQAGRLFDLNRIGRAMIAYHNVSGHLPDNSPLNESEHPTSWRVKLLPYLDEAILYSQYRTDEPWNSDHNIELLERMPPIFGTETKTQVLRIVGYGTVFSDDRQVKLSNVKDDPSLTLFAIRTIDEQAVPWTKPVDSEFDDEMPFQSLIDGSKNSIEAIFLDGHASDISKDADADKLRSLVNPHDGKPASEADQSVGQ